MVLSRLTEEQQVNQVIKAFINVSEATDTLNIYGDGTELKKLICLAKKRNNIFFHGHIDHGNSHKIFKENDCLVISSSEEAGPLTGIEAMAAGLPIVSSKVGAMFERLPNYDFWYDGTQIDLEMKLNRIKIASVDQLELLSIKIRERYLEKYAQKTLKKQYLNSVKKVVLR